MTARTTSRCARLRIRATAPVLLIWQCQACHFRMSAMNVLRVRAVTSCSLESIAYCMCHIGPVSCCKSLTYHSDTGLVTGAVQGAGRLDAAAHRRGAAPPPMTRRTWCCPALAGCCSCNGTCFKLHTPWRCARVAVLRRPGSGGVNRLSWLVATRA